MAKPKKENSRRYYLAAEPCRVFPGHYDLFVTDNIRGRIPLIDLDSNSFQEATSKIHVHIRKENAV